MKKQTVYAFIFARGGSKGLPGKNVRPLGGMPLIGHAIQCAKKCDFIDKVIVSTDDPGIAKVAKDHGAEVPFLRPESLAMDSSSEFEAWKHAVNYFDKEFDVFISLPATSPLRDVEDVYAAYDRFNKGDVDTVITVAEAHRSPYFNMVKINDGGTAELVNQDPSGQRYTRRQDVPEVFDITTVAYVSTPQFISSNKHYFDGRVGAVTIPLNRSIDIDTLSDFEYAEFLYEKRKNNAPN